MSPGRDTSSYLVTLLRVRAAMPTESTIDLDAHAREVAFQIVLLGRYTHVRATRVFLAEIQRRLIYMRG